MVVANVSYAFGMVGATSAMGSIATSPTRKQMTTADYTFAVPIVVYCGTVSSLAGYLVAHGLCRAMKILK